jgi:hypothetical protein
MSSWGYTDNVAIKGTVAVTTAANTVTGTSTEFVSNVKQGDYLTIGGRKYQVDQVNSNTSIYINSVASAIATGQTAYLQQGPKFLANVNSIAGEAGRQNNVSTIQNVYGVDLSEMQTSIVSSISVGTAGNYATAAKSNTTITIATTGALQPSVNATATINYTGANVTSFTITNPGAGYSADVQANTAATIATTGATQPTQNATATLAFTSGTTQSNTSHTGWSSYITYTDANGTVREKSEVLVAMSKNFTAAAAGDDEDTVFPD